MLSDERRPRVLMAVSPRAADRVGRILHGFRLECPASLGQLAHAVRCASFDLVIVGSHFDGSRALEALKMVRWHAPQVPLACVRAVPFCNPLGEATLAALQGAAEELGIDCFVDVLQFPDDDAGNARARAIFERLVFVT
jgi:hypothetical protein